MEHKGLFSILKFHGCIQKENILVSISPSCKQNFIHVNLGKNLKVPSKYIQITHVDGEKFQNCKDLKITMDKYVLHSAFYSLDMDGVDVVLGYPWMQSKGVVNINVENKFLKFWYKKKKITFQDMSLIPQKETKKARDEIFAG